MKNRRDITHSIANIAAAPIACDKPDDCFSWFDTIALLEQMQWVERSDEALDKAAVELLKLFDKKVESVYSVCGIEQEYFIIDRDWYNDRADLMFTGRTLVGMPQPGDRPPESQCAGLKERVFKYMCDVRAEAKMLGFDIQDVDCYDESAPGQYRFTQACEKACPAIDKNMMIMSVMRKVALRHNLVCLLHEKPFAGVNGNGKRISWTLTDEKGDDLLSPGDTLNEKLLFLALAASVVYAVHRHGDLLCAATASAGNENRLGEGETPFAAVSVSLGEQLTKIFAEIELGKPEKGKKRDFADIDAGILPKSTYFGNVSSPVAIAEEAFAFITPGSSMNASIVVTVINTMVADSMTIICDKIKKELSKGKGDKHAANADNGSVGSQHGNAANRKQETITAVMNVLAAAIKESKPILFEGDNRSIEWAEEARRRGLPDAASVCEALKAFAAPKAVDLFGRHKVFSEAELSEIYNVGLLRYEKAIRTEIKTLTEIVNTQVLPSAYNYQADIASGLEVLRVLADDMTIEMTDGALEDRKEMFEKLTADIYRVRKNLKELVALRDKAQGLDVEERVAYLSKEIKPQLAQVRRYVDALEGSMPDDMWPLPKYRDMLCII